MSFEEFRDSQSIHPLKVQPGAKYFSMFLLEDRGRVLGLSHVSKSHEHGYAGMRTFLMVNEKSELQKNSD